MKNPSAEQNNVSWEDLLLESVVKVCWTSVLKSWVNSSWHNFFFFFTENQFHWNMHLEILELLFHERIRANGFKLLSFLYFVSKYISCQVALCWVLATWGKKDCSASVSILKAQQMSVWQINLSDWGVFGVTVI